MDSQNHRKEEKTFLQENGVDLMIRVHDTGIGMAITDQLVQLMGGEIVVESLKDKGSDFTVFLQLPLAEEGSIEHFNAGIPVVFVCLMDNRWRYHRHWYRNMKTARKLWHELSPNSSSICSTSTMP